jgi:hypothetical protein
VVEKIATNPENFYFSSARNYANIEDDLEVCVLFMG